MLKLQVPHLHQTIGIACYKALKFCIEGEFGLKGFAEGEDNSSSDLHLVFENLVVDWLTAG